MEDNIQTQIDRLEELKRQRAAISREIHSLEEKINRWNQAKKYSRQRSSRQLSEPAAMY